MRHVALLVGPPPPELARELEQVRSRARALADYLRSANAPLPEDFPRADILAIAAEMAELPDGTAQGCLSPLEYADTRLADIRSLHFSTIMALHPLDVDHPPTLTREEGLDRDLSGLMVAVATARRVANRIAALEPEERPPEQSVHRETLPGLVGAGSKGTRLEQDLTEVREDFDKVARPNSERADHFRRTLTDARVIAGLSRVELAQENIIPAWLKRFGGWLSDYPMRLEGAGRALEVSVDVVETIHGGWRKYSRRLTDAWYSSIREFAADLEGLGRRLGEPRQTTAVPLEEFAVGKIRSKILAGQAPPATALRKLDLSETRVTDLSPLKSLTALENLNLRDTEVADVTPLKSLIALRELDLSRTKVTDLAPLKSLTVLQTLSASQLMVSDLSPLKGLTALRSLALNSTLVADLSVLQSLINLEALSIESAKITQLSPLRFLTALQSLDAGFTRVSELSPLKDLTALRNLDVAHTPVSSLSRLKV